MVCLFVLAMKIDCYFSFDTKKRRRRVEKGEKIKNHYIRIWLKKNFAFGS